MLAWLMNLGMSGGQVPPASYTFVAQGYSGGSEEAEGHAAGAQAAEGTG